MRQGETIDFVAGGNYDIERLPADADLAALLSGAGIPNDPFGPLQLAAGADAVIVEALQLFDFVQLACGEHLEAARLPGGRLLMFTQRNNRIGF